MTLATRLRMSGGAFLLTPPTVVTLTAAPSGGWTHANDPHAVYDGSDKTFVGYVNGGGDIKIIQFVHSTQTVTDFTLHNVLQVDTHAAPSIIIRPDGKLVAVYGQHDGSTMYCRRSTNAGDISAWQTEQNLDSSLGGSDYTYPHLHYVGTTLYLFYRDFRSGTTAVLCYSTSTDGGVTWSAQTDLYQASGKSAYWKIDSDGSRIDVVTTDGRDPPDAPPTKIYHFYIEGGTRKKSDGTTITASLPLAPSDLTLVYNGGDGVGWPHDIVAGSNPVFVYAVLDTPSTNDWRYARWSGSSWDKTSINTSAGVIDTGFASNVVIDHSNVDVTYAPVKVGGQWEMYAFETGDSGATWAPRAMTLSSTADNIYPSTVRNHAGDLKVIWLYGTYTTYLDFDFGIRGGT